MAHSDDNKRRQEIRKEIQKSSREEFILKEMKRLGFWPSSKNKPSLEEQFIQRRNELGKEIRELSKTDRAFQNKEAVLLKHKKERMLQSREKQKANKQKKIDQRIARENSRKNKLGKDIFYLGNANTKILKEKEVDEQKLKKKGLPSIASVDQLAKLLDTSVKELRFLSFQRKLSKHSHYVRYGIKKKTGGIRKISAPKPRLKKVQRAILDKILAKQNCSVYAHGFLPSKSIVTNAKPHIGADILINMDLENFFPTLNYKRVFGLFKGMGFSKQLATILSHIATEPEEKLIKVHGQKMYLYEGERYLPQGAPTSPMITNLICRRMDQRLAGVAKKLGFKYTRYADDLSFSSSNAQKGQVNKLVWQVRAVIKNEQFKINKNKTQIMRNGHRKEVTGIVVNEKCSISRKKMKAFRATLYQIEKEGLAGKTWGQSTDVLNSIEGFARYVNMVDKEKGKKLLAQVEKLNNQYRPKSKGILGKLLRKKDNGSKPWWKIW